MEQADRDRALIFLLSTICFIVTIILGTWAALVSALALWQILGWLALNSLLVAIILFLVNIWIGRIS